MTVARVSAAFVLSSSALVATACSTDEPDPSADSDGVANVAASGDGANVAGATGTAIGTDTSSAGASEPAGNPTGTTAAGGAAGNDTTGVDVNTADPAADLASGGFGNADPSGDDLQVGESGSSTGGLGTVDSAAEAGASDGGASDTAGGDTGGGLNVAGGASRGGQGTGGATVAAPAGLLWPIDCVPDETCLDIGYPDVDGDGLAFDCGGPGYEGHEGTDIPVTWEQMDEGVDVFAAAEGEVLWAFDGKYDRCPDDTQADCQDADYAAGSRDGILACTELGPYCGTGSGNCFWCFAGGNVIVIRHVDRPGVFATRYDHLRQGSVLVEAGDVVSAGQPIAQVGSAGNSTGPHLHFEVWSTGFYELTEPWVGDCGPNTSESLWASEPPWSAELSQ